MAAGAGGEDRCLQGLTMESRADLGLHRLLFSVCLDVLGGDGGRGPEGLCWARLGSALGRALSPPPHLIPPCLTSS